MNLTAPDEHQLLIFWTQILVLLLVARLLGQAMRSIGQPAVVGQLGAGLVLGPTLLGRVAPDALEWLVPADPMQSGMLFAVAWIGVLLLLIETGFDTDLSLIRRLGRATALVSAGSILLPLVVGVAVGASLPDVFIGELDDPLVFTLFIAAALSISSLAVAGKVLSDLGLLRRDFGQITIAAGMANDVVGWIMLGVLASLAAAGEVAPGPLAVTIGGIAVLYIGGLTIGQRGVDAVLRQLRQRQVGLTGSVTAVLAISLVFGVATQLIGAEAVLGAFVAGILINRSRFDQRAVREGFETITAGFFAPIFFATAGLRVDLGLLADGEVLRWTITIVVAASVAKFVGSYIGARLASLHSREGVLLGLGLNPRGTLEIVIATVGLSVGVLNEASYTAIMVMTILLSMLAPPLLRAIAHSWEGTDEEQARLRREEALERNVVVRPQRLLLPSQGGPNSIVAAQLLHLVWPEEVGATVLTVGPDADATGVKAVLDVFEDRGAELVEVDSLDAVGAILDEAKLGYGAIAVGAPEASDHRSIVSPVVDELLRASSLPLVIVRRARLLDRRLPGAFARGVIPVSPDAVSRSAQEVGLTLSAKLGTEMVLLHRVDGADPDHPGESSEERTVARNGNSDSDAGADSDTDSDSDAGFTSGSFLSRLWGSGSDTTTTIAVAARPAVHDVAARVMDQVVALAGELDARVRTVVAPGASTAATIVRTVRECEADLVVIGAELHHLDDRPFLGHTVEEVLDTCDATVVVVVNPENRADSAGR